MVIIFLLSAHLGTIASAVAIWAIYGFWQAALLAPVVGCASGTLALVVAGRCHSGVPIGVQHDRITDQVSALAEIVAASKKGVQERPAALTRPSGEQAA